jgi:hypothetical protein
MRFGKIQHACANVVSPRPHLFRIYDLRPPEELPSGTQRLLHSSRGQRVNHAVMLPLCAKESLDLAPPARWSGLPSETSALHLQVKQGYSLGRAF